VSQASRLRALEAEGLLHPRADAVSAELFAHGGFFLAADKVQVKYEMLRAHLLDGVSVTAAAAAHGEVVSIFVEVEVAVPHLRPAVR
jgi:hypothetical protein